MKKNTDSKLPLVSVIVNCYNGEKFLRKCIESILYSSYQKFEIIFYDNASTDNSIKIVEHFQSKKITIIKRTNNINLGGARAEAVNKSNGELICFLDVDDLIESDAIEYYVECYKDYKFDILYGGVQYIDVNEKNINKYTPKNNLCVKLDQLLRNFDVNVPSMCISRKVITSYKINFDNKIKCCEEFDIVAQLAAFQGKIISVGKIFSKYRIHDMSLTSNNLDIGAKERRYIMKKIKCLVDVDSTKYFKYAYYKSYYYDALFLSKKGEIKKAIKNMNKAKNYSLVFLVLYWTLKISPKIWLLVHRIKGRKILRI